MTIYNLLCLLGVPSLVAAAVGALVAKWRADRAIKPSLQALLRAQMIDDYNRWSDKGYAPIYARENFENLWKQYHALGANGVMNDIHTRFTQLPTSKGGN